ncbi:hypothetical protein T484DRAFT_1833299 [Baffinella frigidus]|nr:hypothetical protein T484DRAFT_1833299 [Cryptophyta sp. CCMP2293]
MCGAVVCAACSPHRPRGKRVCESCVEEGGGAALDLNGSTATAPAGRAHGPTSGRSGLPRDASGRPGVDGPASGRTAPPRDDGSASGRARDGPASGRGGPASGRGRGAHVQVQVPDFTAESRVSQRVIYSAH